VKTLQRSRQGAGDRAGRVGADDVGQAGGDVIGLGIAAKVSEGEHDEAQLAQEGERDDSA